MIAASRSTPATRALENNLRALDVVARNTARAAGLRYVALDEGEGPTGLRRVRHGKDFRYVDASGRPCNAATVKRVRALAIPPAWENVWIAADPNAHIQATGRDARGRKQYRYHPRWRSARDQSKYEKMVRFAQALPKVRESVRKLLGQKKPSRERLLALMVLILEQTHIRVGNEEYVRANGSFGLTTLRRRHVRIEGTTLSFRFRGKSGVERDLQLRDRRIARLLLESTARRRDSEHLFRYADADGRLHRVRSQDVNAFLREVSGHDITAKDFRTWAATVLAARVLSAMNHENVTGAKRNLVAAVREVALHLGNTPAVCRRSYIHPAIFDAYRDGSLRALRTASLAHSRSAAAFGLTEEEHRVRNLLRSYGVGALAA